MISSQDLSKAHQESKIKEKGGRRKKRTHPLIATPLIVAVDLLSIKDSRLSYGRWQRKKDGTPLQSYLKLPINSGNPSITAIGDG